MSDNDGFSRRTFLKNAGMTALVGAVGTGTSMATAAAFAPLEPQDSTYDFDEVYDRVGSDCDKWDRQIEKYGKENIAVPMGIADMDFRTAPVITRALRERIQHENWGYLDMPPSYIESIVDWNKRRYGIEINPDLIMHSDGVHPGLLSALKAFSPPGSKVIVLAPTYSAFYSDIRIVGCKEEENQLKLVNGRYVMDFEDLERRIDHDTNTLILCNPQNPTGNCWSEEDLLRLGRLCLERRVVVLADEIHCDFVMKGQKYVPFASLPDKDVVDNSVTFKAISKTFSLAAMKSAYFFSTNPEYLRKVDTSHRADINTLGIVANEAAYREGADWFDQLLPYIDGNHDYVVAYTKEKMPLVDYTKAQGTYLAWLDVTKLADKIDAKGKAEAASKTSERPVTPEVIVQSWFVENAHVFMGAGSSYGTGGAGHMRMNLGTSRKLIELALDNMAQAMDKI